MTNPNFTASISTNDLYRDLDTTVCLTDLLDGYDADIAELQAAIGDGGDYADADHTHSEYALTTTVNALQDAVASKADSNHTHSEYAASNHTHDGYVSTSDFDALEAEVDGKAAAMHTHADYASVSHTHDNYSAVGHDHDEDYAAINHSHSDYATTTALSELSATVSGKANSSHTHDDRYYTESEIDSKLDDKADANHNHDSAYDAKGSASAALTSANAYTDEQIESLDYAASSHSHTIANVSNLQNELDALESAISGKADASHTHTVDTALSGTSTNPVQNKVINSALAGKANTSHGNHVPATQTANNAVFLRNDNSWQTVTPANIGAYTKSEIDSKVSTLNTAINGKAASSHNHDDRYYTEAEVDAKFDAIIGEGASTTLDTIGEISAAIEDNQDMLETLNSAIGTKANASDLTSHTGNKSNPHGVTASQVGAYTKAEVDSKLSGKADSGHTHTVDSALSGTSTNPVQNKVVKSALDGKANASHGNHVPATQTADNAKFLRNDNTWQSVTPANIGAYTKSEIDSKVSTLNTAINGKAASDHTHSAYANQNAFSNVKVGTTTVSADSATDTLELAGSNVTITSDATNDKVTIGITKANVTNALGYTPPTTNTTYNAATTSTAGLMSAADKSKLDGIAANANNYTYTLPAAGSSLGGVKSGGDVTISSGTITVKDDSHNHVISNVDGLQSALDGKAASSHTHSYLPLSGGTLTGDITFENNHGRIYGVDYSRDVDGIVKEVLVGQTLDGNTSIGYGNYYEQSGSTNIYGDSITMTSRTSGLFEREYGVNKILWQGNLHMNASQTITLLDTIQHQPNGIVLVWSEYNSSTNTVQNQGFVTHFIPKILVELQPARFHTFPFMVWSYQSKQFVKGLYISDGDITGHSINTDTSDQTAPVNSYVLRYVIGV